MSIVIQNRYEVTDVLSAGGQGCVYMALDPIAGRLVAVKERIARGEEEAEKNLMEATALAGCFHPMLPQVLEVIREENRNYIVMEMIPGKNLKRVVEESGRMSQEEVILIALKLCDLLEYLHSLSPGIIYGDLKPENVIVQSNGRIRVVDFGNAGIKDEVGGQGRCASLGFAPKEQIQKGILTERCDIYSLGCLMHYLLSGEDPTKPPFIRRPLEEVDCTIREDLIEVVEKCMAEKPQNRYRNVFEVMQDLKSVKERRSGKRRRVKRGAYRREKLVILSSVKRIGVMLLITLVLEGAIFLTSRMLSAKASQFSEKKPVSVTLISHTGERNIVGRINGKGY